MRGKRSKQYRKLMQAYSLTFGFRPPYQVLVDAEMIQDTEKFKMDIVGGLERSLGEKVKPMVTQCSIRHLYTLKDIPQPQKDTLIATAKNMERRRCNHHTLDEPLSTLECFKSVIDPKDSLTNKNRYVVASQDEAVRRFCRDVKGVPLVFVRRSVMIMEPMADSSIGVREGLERSKVRSGLKARGLSSLGKRKRGDENNHEDIARETEADDVPENGESLVEKKKKAKGPKGPNPLAVKKSKKATPASEKFETDDQGLRQMADESGGKAHIQRFELDIPQQAPEDAREPRTKRKRKRKSKPRTSDPPAETITVQDKASE